MRTTAITATLLATAATLSLGALASAQPSTSAPAQPSTSAPAPGTPTSSTPVQKPPAGKAEIRLSVKQGVPGTKLRVETKCPTVGWNLSSPALELGAQSHRPGYYIREATVKSVKPGRYTVKLQCTDRLGEPVPIATSASFTVLAPNAPKPKQVTVKPKGAPQTGGGFLVVGD